MCGDSEGKELMPGSSGPGEQLSRKPLLRECGWKSVPSDATGSGSWAKTKQTSVILHQERIVLFCNSIIVERARTKLELLPPGKEGLFP